MQEGLLPLEGSGDPPTATVGARIEWGVGDFVDQETVFLSSLDESGTHSLGLYATAMDKLREKPLFVELAELSQVLLGAGGTPSFTELKLVHPEAAEDMLPLRVLLCTTPWLVEFAPQALFDLLGDRLSEFSETDAALGR